MNDFSQSTVRGNVLIVVGVSIWVAHSLGKLYRSVIRHTWKVQFVRDWIETKPLKTKKNVNFFDRVVFVGFVCYRVPIVLSLSVSKLWLQTGL